MSSVSVAQPVPGWNGAMVASGAHAAPNLKAAAREFESVLLGQWLQNAESSFGSVPGGDEDTDPGGDQMQSFGMQQLAGQLTASGGIGIAKIVENALGEANQHAPSISESVAAGTGSAESLLYGPRAVSAIVTSSTETNR